jgi:hypothetical protein
MSSLRGDHGGVPAHDLEGVAREEDEFIADYS